MDDQSRFYGNDLVTTLSRQSGRSSVENALIVGHEFQTGMCPPAVSMATECQILRRNYSEFFRRQGVESDLTLRVIDTHPQLPRPQTLQALCPDGVHVLVLVVKVDQQNENTHLQQYAESLFGPDWRRHAVLVFTHTDHLKAAGLHPSVFLSLTTDWLRALAEEVGGGVCFLDNSRDWPLIRGHPLRDQLLCVSAKNHHKALKVRTDV